MAWTTSNSDLRTLLSDGPTDRYHTRKRCFGELNGTNLNFRTLEFRRITDFTATSSPLGVYLNGSIVTVASDNTATGDFVLSVAPVDGDLLEASYYSQNFIDTEIDEFLSKASSWLGLGVDPTTVPDGLWESCLKYAASSAYLKMAVKMQDPLSTMYRADDMPQKDVQLVVKGFSDMAESFQKMSRSLRDDFYRRQGQALQPLFNAVIGTVRNTTPRG